MASDTRPPLPPEWARVRKIGDAEGYARAIADVCAWLKTDETDSALVGRHVGAFSTAAIVREIEARFGGKP